MPRPRSPLGLNFLLGQPGRRMLHQVPAMLGKQLPIMSSPPPPTGEPQAPSSRKRPDCSHTSSLCANQHATGAHCFKSLSEKKTSRSRGSRTC